MAKKRDTFMAGRIDRPPEPPDVACARWLMAACRRYIEGRAAASEIEQAFAEFTSTRKGSTREST